MKGKTGEIAVNFYIKGSKKDEEIQEILDKYGIPYMKFDKIPSRYRTQLPCITIGDPTRNPFGPVHDNETIESLAKKLASLDYPLVDPRTQ